jgi:hypothetical protein
VDPLRRDRDAVEGRIALQAGVPLVFALALAGLIFALSGAAFAESFLANFLATVLGVLAAIPVTLWLDRFVETQHRRAEALEKAADSAGRQIELLRLLRDELATNKDLLTSRGPASGEGDHPVPLLATETWEAIRDGGEVDSLQSIDTLTRVERAYRLIRTNVFLEERYLEASLGESQPVAAGSPADRWRRVVVQSDRHVIEALDAALARVDADLAGLTSTVFAR